MWDLGSGLPTIVQDGNATYVYGHGLISQTSSGGAQTYHLADGLGSTVALTDTNGNVTGSYQYDVFGAIKSATGTASSEFTYTGQQQDPATNLVYLRARYYDPTLGRFLTKDPFHGFATRPQSQHRYAYVENSPANAVDPSGRSASVAVMPQQPPGFALTGEALALVGASGQRRRGAHRERGRYRCRLRDALREIAQWRPAGEP
ncbi:MAG: RHS repeat-associated core domain-containing protein [Chloroflexota bacterium]